MPASASPRFAHHDEPFDSLPNVAQAHVTARCTVQLWWPRPGFSVTRARGHVDVAAARFLGDAIRAHFARNALRGLAFHDWSGVTDYDGAARILLMDLTRDILPRSDGVHLLATSPLVLFGVRAASAVFPKLHAYDDRAKFDAALGAALRDRPI